MFSNFGTSATQAAFMAFVAIPAWASEGPAAMPPAAPSQPTRTSDWSTAQRPSDDVQAISPVAATSPSFDPAPVQHASAVPTWANAQASLDRWSGLPEGWDGAEAAQPSQAAIGNARTFVRQMEAAALPAPTPYITSDAEFGFRWAKEDGFASVSFADDGHVIVFCREPGAPKALKIDAPFVGADLGDLFVGIRRLA